MKKVLLCVILLLTLVNCNYKNDIETTAIQASSYIVIEQSTNKILQGSNYDTQRSVASISKIMTAIIVVENVDIYQYTIVPNEIIKVEGSSMYLKVNDKIKIKDLLYGLLLRSGNDAAITLALTICDTIDEFVCLMNKKAEKLNMKNSFFSNPHGLDEKDNGNISTAFDMALLYSYCLQNPIFSEIISSKNYNNYVNKNKLLKNYQYCTGGKTGYTKKAKRTLITSASKDNINLIVVTLNCGNDFQTHQNLYEHYFNNYQAIKIINKGINIFDNKEIYCNKDCYFITNQTDLSLLYQIDYSKKIINVTLLDINKRVIDYTEIGFLITNNNKSAD